MKIRSLPKVSLHDHLDGALRPETIIELARASSITLPTEDATELSEWFTTSAGSGSLDSYLATFAVTLSVLQTESALRRVAHEYVHDLHDDGVIYGEVRWAPEQHQEAGLSLDDAVRAVAKGISDAEASIRKAGGDIRVTQILCAMRQGTRSAEIAALTIRHRDRGVVAFDIAGPESGFPPSGHREAFELLATSLMPVTVHAGEADGVDSIRSALYDGRALRLGHGVRIAEDIDIDSQDDENTYVRLGRLAEWVKDREIALELCPTSNLQTDAWGTELRDHPFDLLYQLGFRVTVSCDNRLMSGTTLTHELSELCDTFAYGIDDLEVFQLNAAAAAFLPADERARLAVTISEAFERV